MIIDEESPSIKNQPFSPEVQEQQMKEMIRRDRNHPSIMFWGIGTETNHAVDPQFAMAEDTTRILTATRVVNMAQQTYRIHTFEGMINENALKDIYPLMRENNSVTEGAVAGEPARIVLTSLNSKITSDLASVAVIKADIVDSKGNHVNGANNTVRWSVSGPATLAGPSLYEPDVDKNHEMKGVWYTDMPVSNVIRSTGKPGRIRVTVSASGLASGSIEIDAEPAKPDNLVVTEPLLDENGRIPVAKQFFTIARLDDTPQEIKRSNDDVTLKAADIRGYESAIKDHILRNNPAVDTATVEFGTLLSLFTSHLMKNNGSLVADDYNFNVDHYNTCRQISGYINATKLPPLYKETLKKYYTDVIITGGNEKNAGDEMNWINWIPSGGTVIVSQEGNIPSWPKGTIVTNKSALYDLITTVYPVFDKYSNDAKERALTFISKMNPYIIVKEVSTQSREGDQKKVTAVTYTAERGKPILIPLIKFISE